MVTMPETTKADILLIHKEKIGLQCRVLTSYISYWLR